VLPFASTACPEILAPRLRSRRGGLQHFDNFCFQVFLFGFEDLRTDDIAGNSPLYKDHHPIMSGDTRSFKSGRFYRQFKYVAAFGH
jgi:hypothetical protein